MLCKVKIDNDLILNGRKMKEGDEVDLPKSLADRLNDKGVVSVIKPKTTTKKTTPKKSVFKSTVDEDKEDIDAKY